MLFDEATSALDSQSEAVVQKSIDELLKAKERPTTVVVAHRLSTIVGCDCICVLQHGRLVESGTHAELMQKTDGLYEYAHIDFLIMTAGI
jgi:ABC-type multidrug transport system fused ATPase/permease subunit